MARCTIILAGNYITHGLENRNIENNQRILMRTSYDVQLDRPVHDDELDIHVLTVLVQKVRHEVRHRFVRDVTAQHNMSKNVKKHTL